MNDGVIVVGGGVAGLACAAELSRRGRRVLLLEAGGRFGGRVHTIAHSTAGVPVELGAEFIHGNPPEIFDLLKAQGIQPIEAGGDDWCATPAGLARCDFFEQTQDLLDRMKRVGERDMSFSEFLSTVPDAEAGAAVRRRALNYVEGFNAARADEISVQSLLDDMQAQEQVGGDTSYRLAEGYRSVIVLLQKQCKAAGVKLRLEHQVTSVDWQRKVKVRGTSPAGIFTTSSDAVVVTVPAALLRAKTIAFAPELPGHIQIALQGVATGQVLRLMLVFKERFWTELKAQDGRSLAGMRFLFSEHPFFPTFWTTNPLESHALVAWSPARKAESMFAGGKEYAIARALDALAENLNFHRAQLTELLESAHMHPWHQDPHARGAYSYYCVGAAKAPEVLSLPIGSRLFLAGEATALGGHHSTVHGAIASGYRAARQVVGGVS